MEVHKNSGRKYCSECLPEYNRRKAREWYTGHRRECRVQMSIRSLAKRHADPQYDLLCRARKRARDTNSEIALEKEDIVVPDVCPILGTPFVRNTYYTYSIDRVDNSKGYTKDNVQVISHKANAMKNSAIPEELVLFANWVYKTYPAYLTSTTRVPNVYELKKGEDIEEILPSTGV